MAKKAELVVADRKLANFLVGVQAAIDGLQHRLLVLFGEREARDFERAFQHLGRDARAGLRIEERDVGGGTDREASGGRAEDARRIRGDARARGGERRPALLAPARIDLDRSLGAGRPPPRAAARPVPGRHLA